MQIPYFFPKYVHFFLNHRNINECQQVSASEVKKKLNKKKHFNLLTCILTECDIEIRLSHGLPAFLIGSFNVLNCQMCTSKDVN